MRHARGCGPRKHTASFAQLLSEIRDEALLQIHGHPRMLTSNELPRIIQTSRPERKGCYAGRNRDIQQAWNQVPRRVIPHPPPQCLGVSSQGSTVEEREIDLLPQEEETTIQDAI